MEELRVSCLPPSTTTIDFQWNHPPSQTTHHHSNPQQPPLQQTTSTNHHLHKPPHHLVGVPFERHRSSPLEVPRDTPWLETIPDPASCDGLGVGGPHTPLYGSVEVVKKEGFKLGQVEEEVMGLFDGGLQRTQLAAGVLQFHGIDQLATLVTLVSSRVCVGAEGTLPLHETIR